jgi:putative membrane protein
MKAIQIFFVALVAFEHIYFMILEMFYWDKPKGLKAFGQTLEAAKSSKILAKNQGLYNGFLAAGLLWAIVNKTNFEQLAIFFLSCAVVAGIFGAYTTKNIKLFYVQALPALIGLLLVIFGN